MATKRNAFLLVTGGGVVLLAAGALTLAQDDSAPLVRTDLGYSELPDGRGGTNVEAIAYTDMLPEVPRACRKAPRSPRSRFSRQYRSPFGFFDERVRGPAERG